MLIFRYFKINSSNNNKTEFLNSCKFTLAKKNALAVMNITLNC